MKDETGRGWTARHGYFSPNITEPKKYRDDGLIPSVENPGQPMTNEEYQDIATKQLHDVVDIKATHNTDTVEYSDWRVHVLNGVVFTPKKNCEPNWFHRRMQELAFGVRWERVP
jgi:hypothetical protein